MSCQTVYHTPMSCSYREHQHGVLQSILQRQPYEDPRPLQTAWPQVPTPMFNCMLYCAPSVYQDQPIDLSVKNRQTPSPTSSYTSTSSCSSASSYPSTSSYDIHSERSTPSPSTSMLRSILERGSKNNPYMYPSQNYSVNTDANTRVTLAKKNLLPVCSRVSDWLVKIILFAKSLPEFASLPHNDKVDLILNCWTRLLVLLMAEDNFQFVVTPTCQNSRPESPDDAIPPETPTKTNVETIRLFVLKCQELQLDAKEYFYLSVALLFNASNCRLEAESHVNQTSKLILELLRRHTETTHPGSPIRYSKVLLCLPMLYSINNKMVENLFCMLIKEKNDMELLLKHMLQTV